ncbi:hypothetical protein [Streptomyces clavuligerus]|uniref:hypothetical protein n=1 Tax=Streptomyces clavuligerus TaxID=1901 RepID=UPI00017FF6FB|nr:hypothetical protein [Streptomyces clavuligerus]EDY48253.1 conserved hypothetical protein [Streptomyces clavuligerus]WDN52516.1 hypothetical protein LL058_12035 [Streptomyces clavuligerus]
MDEPFIRLAASVEAGEKVLADWDAVSDSLCDADGWALDDRYDLRKQQRDADMWTLFAPYLDEGTALLVPAEDILPGLNQGQRFEQRWDQRLRTLREALDGGRRVHDEWLAVENALVPGHPRTDEVRAEALVERNAEGWHYSLTWTENADALVEIARAAEPLAGPILQESRTLRAQAALARSPQTGLSTPAPAPSPGPKTGSVPDRRGGRAR